MAAFLFWGWVVVASAQDLQTFEACRLVNAGWADGDSFPVKLPDGRDLGEVLVGEGLARSYGVRRNTPDGLNAEAAKEHMDDLELGAAIARRGIWAKTDPQRLVTLRETRRAEERQLQEAFGMGPGEPIDPNTATVDEIMLLPGIGEVLAERIVEGRPYKSVEDLRRVPGIGEKVFAGLKDSLQIAP